MKNILIKQDNKWYKGVLTKQKRYTPHPYIYFEGGAMTIKQAERYIDKFKEQYNKEVYEIYGKITDDKYKELVTNTPVENKKELKKMAMPLPADFLKEFLIEIIEKGKKPKNYKITKITNN